MTRQTLINKRSEILQLAKQYHTSDVRIFGSVARGDNGPESDVDFLVKTMPECSLFDLGGLLMDLQELLGCEVDVVTDDTLKPRVREKVLKEAVSI